MKRYLVFSFDHYYPEGGWGDFRGSFDSDIDALIAGMAHEPLSPSGWSFHIIDLQSMAKIHEQSFK